MGFNEWGFLTTHNWGEESKGEWILEISNGYRAGKFFFLNSAPFYGSVFACQDSQIPIYSFCSLNYDKIVCHFVIGKRARLNSWSLVLYGTATPPLATPHPVAPTAQPFYPRMKVKQPYYINVVMARKRTKSMLLFFVFMTLPPFNI